MRTVNNINTLLRYPLRIGVIMNHLELPYTYVFESLAVFNFFQYFCSKILGTSSVPLFMFTAGYYLFYKTPVFNAKIYLEKIKKRSKSLLIPFILWNIIWLAFVAFFKLPEYTHFYPDGITFSNFLNSFWGIVDGSPILWAAWFLRDLMLLVIISPAIYIIIKYTHFFIPVIVFGLWIFGYDPNIVGISLRALASFMLGVYFSINKIAYGNILKKIPFVAILILSLSLIFIDLYTQNPIINKLDVLVLIVLILVVAERFSHLASSKIISILLPASFFVYLAHLFVLVVIQKTMYKIFTLNDSIDYCIFYTITVILTLAITTALFFLLKKIAPKSLAVLVGGRI